MSLTLEQIDQRIDVFLRYLAYMIDLKLNDVPERRPLARL